MEKRVRVHNEGKGAKYTRAKRPVHCIYHERFETKREAMQAEYQFKQLNEKCERTLYWKGANVDEVTEKC